MKKRCFVISPIGARDSSVREHADDVFEFIIKPAMDELGIHAYRSDHSQEVGRITEQMYASILEDDLCIAVLTYHNPNVFYELAIAQCAARPVIIMIEKEHSIPFDIRDIRAVEYDLKPRPLRDRTYVRQIVELVRSLERCDWKVDVPFGTNLSPLGSSKNGLRVFGKLEDFGPTEKWLSVLRDAKRSIDLAGFSLKWWIKLTEFKSLLIEKARAGVMIRCLLIPSASELMPEKTLDKRDRSLDSSLRSLKWFSEVSEESDLIHVRMAHERFLNYQITKTESELLVTLPIQARQPASQYPLLQCRLDSPLHSAFGEEFDALWNASPVESEA